MPGNSCPDYGMPAPPGLIPPWGQRLANTPGRPRARAGRGGPRMAFPRRARARAAHAARRIERPRRRRPPPAVFSSASRTDPVFLLDELAAPARALTAGTPHAAPRVAPPSASNRSGTASGRRRRASAGLGLDAEPVNARETGRARRLDRARRAGVRRRPRTRARRAVAYAAKGGDPRGDSRAQELITGSGAPDPSTRRVRARGPARSAEIDIAESPDVAGGSW